MKPTVSGLAPVVGVLAAPGAGVSASVFLQPIPSASAPSSTAPSSGRRPREGLAPLIRGEAPPPYRDGLPQYVRLKNVPVPKELSTSFEI